MAQSDANGVIPPKLAEAQERDPRRGAYARLTGLALMLGLVVAALLNVFGQRPATSSAAGTAGTLSVSAADRIRGGLLFQAVFEIHAAGAIRRPTLVLDPGWLDSMTLNTLEPSPTNEWSDGDRLKLRFGALRPGQSMRVWTEWQANPTNLGSQSQGVSLDDGGRQVARVNRSVTVFP